MRAREYVLAKARLAAPDRVARCHWCGDPANTVDHLNGDNSDHRHENLAPACTFCNSSRGGSGRARPRPKPAHKRAEAVQRAAANNLRLV